MTEDPKSPNDVDGVSQKDENGSEEKKLTEREQYFNALAIWYTNYMNHVQQINAATASFYYHLMTQFQPTPIANGLQLSGVRRPERGAGGRLFGPVRAARQDEVNFKQSTWESFN